MTAAYLAFIFYAFQQHQRDGHHGEFDGCRRCGDGQLTLLGKCDTMIFRATNSDKWQGAFLFIATNQYLFVPRILGRKKSLHLASW